MGHWAPQGSAVPAGGYGPARTTSTCLHLGHSVIRGMVSVTVGGRRARVRVRGARARGCSSSKRCGGARGAKAQEGEGSPLLSPPHELAVRRRASEEGEGHPHSEATDFLRCCSWKEVAVYRCIYRRMGGTLVYKIQ